MPFRLSPPELILILSILVLVFGVGRLGAELGKGLRALRAYLNNNPPES